MVVGVSGGVNEMVVEVAGDVNERVVEVTGDIGHNSRCEVCTLCGSDPDGAMAVSSISREVDGASDSGVIHEGSTKPRDSSTSLGIEHPKATWFPALEGIGAKLALITPHLGYGFGRLTLEQVPPAAEVVSVEDVGAVRADLIGVDDRTDLVVRAGFSCRLR